MSGIPLKNQFKLLALFFIFTSVAFTHCGVPNFVMPEKETLSDSSPPSLPPLPPTDPRTDPNNPPVIDPSPPATPQSWKDEFFHDVPHGELDILLALHNKKKMEPYLDALKEQSTIFLSGLIDPPYTRTYGGKFSFRINLVSSSSSQLLPTDISAENAFQGSLNRLHQSINSLPIDFGETKNELLKQVIEISSGPFLRKGNSRFFLILISNMEDESSSDPQSTINALYSKKLKDLVHLYGSFFHPNTDKCNEYTYRRGIRLKSLITLSKGWSYELCELPPKGATFMNELLLKIYSQMTRKILTLQPRLDTIAVYHNGLEIEPDQWTYHSVQNEITLKPTLPTLKLGDKVDIVYQTK